MRNRRTQQCPRCKEPTLYKNGNRDYAVSHVDQKRICADCGVKEVLELAQKKIKIILEHHRKTLSHA